MGSKKLLLGTGLAVALLLTAGLSVPGFSQVRPAGSRIPQQVIINGQMVTAVNVVSPDGGFQSYTCTNPQQYSTADGSSQGWACYSPSTGVWLLNALGPVQAQVPQPPPAQPVPTPQPQPVPQTQAPLPPAPLPQAQLPPAQQPAVVYPQQAPTVIYQQPPTIVYAAPVYAPAPVIFAPAYPPSVVLGTAAIGAASRIISAAIIGGYRYPRVYYAPARPYFRGGRR